MHGAVPLEPQHMYTNLETLTKCPALDTSQLDIWELNEASVSPNSATSHCLPDAPTQTCNNSPDTKHEQKCCLSCEIYLRRINGLENELQILTNNIHSLFKTAKEEIQRKDKLIQEKDDIIRQLRKTKTNKQHKK